MEDFKKQKTGRGNQKAVYSTMGNILEMAENELEKSFNAQTALIAIKAAAEMTKVYLAEVVASREARENESHRAVIKNSQVRIRNIENKIFDELPA